MSGSIVDVVLLIIWERLWYITVCVSRGERWLPKRQVRTVAGTELSLFFLALSLKFFTNSCVGRYIIPIILTHTTGGTLIILTQVAMYSWPMFVR
jgi:hypothetical protein